MDGCLDRDVFRQTAPTARQLGRGVDELLHAQCEQTHDYLKRRVHIRRRRTGISRVIRKGQRFERLDMRFGLRLVGSLVSASRSSRSVSSSA